MGGPVVPQQAGLMTQQQQPMTSQPGQFGNINNPMGAQSSMIPGNDSVAGQGLFENNRFII